MSKLLPDGWWLERLSPGTDMVTVDIGWSERLSAGTDTVTDRSLTAVTIRLTPLAYTSPYTGRFTRLGLVGVCHEAKGVFIAPTPDGTIDTRSLLEWAAKHMIPITPTRSTP